MTGLITDGLAHWARSTPEQPAIVFDGDDVVDYATLARWTDRAADLLLDAGLAASSRVGVVGANGLPWCVAAIGALKLGAVVVPYNDRFTVPELEHLISDSDPTFVLTDRTAQDRIVEAVGARAVKVLALDEFTALRDGAPSRPRPQPSRDPDGLAMIVYTSGSTAAPKGVMYTHRTMLAFIAELAVCEPALRAGARMIYTLSMSGAPGLPWHIMQALTRGMTVFYERGFDAKVALRRLCDDRVEVMSGVPLQFEQIAALPEFGHADLSALKMCTIAGARVPLPTVQAWLDKGVPLRQAYGMTELSGLASINPAPEATRRARSIGRGFAFTHLRVVNPDGGDCDPGQPGEIVVRGPGITPGYWRNADATAELVRGGWLHTGDIGIADSQGYIEVVDRMKDLIISGGYNIAPSEIEAVISEMPGVVEVCVIAAGDAKFGEAPAAIVHGRTSITSTDVVAWCNQRLAAYKVPRYVVIEANALPRMASTKIDRKKIRSRYGDVGDLQPRVR